MVSLSYLDKTATKRKRKADLHGLSFDECQLILSPLQDTVRELRNEVKRFSKVAHLVWSTWSVIQVKIHLFYFEPFDRVNLVSYSGKELNLSIFK